MQRVLHGVYKHFKGAYYEVLEIAKHSETGEKMVVYRDLTDSSKVWVRPYDMFISKVNKEEYPDAQQEYRFELVFVKEM